MKPRIYKKLCKKAVAILIYGFDFSVEDFISDNSGIPYVLIKDCYEPFEQTALDMLLEMMQVQDLDCDVHTLKANAKLIKEGIRFTASIYLSTREGTL